LKTEPIDKAIAEKENELKRNQELVNEKKI